jgi:hypothetical protein
LARIVGRVEGEKRGARKRRKTRERDGKRFE